MAGRSLPVAAVCAAILLSQPGGAAAAADPAIFSIDDKDYTLADVAGVSEAELRKRFDAEARDIAPADLLARLGPAEQAVVMALPEAARREAAATRVYQACRRSAVDRAMHDMAHARMADRVMREHEIAAGEYFDVESMRASTRRFRHYLRTLYTDVDLADRDEALYARVPAGLIGKDRWLKARQDLRARGVLSQWRVLFCLSSPHYEDVSLRQFMVEPLLHDVCTTGSYRREGVELATAERSVHLRLTVSGYTGERRALDALASAMVKDGHVQDAGVARAIEVFKAIPSVAVEARVGFGTLSADRLVPPRLGEFREGAPGVFTLAGLVKRFDPSAADQSQQEAFEMSANNTAFRIAGREYLPVVTPHEAGLAIDYQLLVEAARSDAINPFVPEVDRATYKRKVFPATLFDATRSSRPVLQSLAARTAVALARADRDAVGALREEISRARRATASGPARKQFDALEERLQGLSRSP